MVPTPKQIREVAMHVDVRRDEYRITAEWLTLHAEECAAAPELLAALEFVSKYAAMRESKGDQLPSQLIGAVRAAIAKAKGLTAGLAGKE